MSRCRCPDPAGCIGWSIRTPAIPCWWSRRRRRFAASSSGRISSSCRCSNSIHGVAVRPNSDDVTAEIAADKIILGRPGGLTLSSADVAAERAPTAVRPIFDVDEWRKNQAGQLHRAGGGADRCRGGGRARSAHAGPDRSRPFLSGARDVSGSQGRSRSRARRYQAEASRIRVALIVHSVASIADGPSRAGAEGSRQSGDRQPITIRNCGRRWPMRVRANGRRRARNSRTSNSPSPRCRSSCSAS